jgi:hypothetical protein
VLGSSSSIEFSFYWIVQIVSLVLVVFVEFWSIGYLGVVVELKWCQELNIVLWVYFSCFV